MIPVGRMLKGKQGMNGEYFKRVGTALATAGRKWDEKFHKPVLWVEAFVLALLLVCLFAFLGVEWETHAKAKRMTTLRLVLTSYRTLQFQAVGKWLSAELAAGDEHAILVLGDTAPGNSQVTGLCRRLQRPSVTVQIVSPFNYWAGSRSVDDFGIVAKILKDHPEAQLVVDLAAHHYDGRLDQVKGGPRFVCFFDTPDLPTEMGDGLRAGRLVGAVCLSLQAANRLMDRRGGPAKVTEQDLAELIAMPFTRESVTKEKEASRKARSSIVVPYEVWARQASAPAN